MIWEKGPSCTHVTYTLPYIDLYRTHIYVILMVMTIVDSVGNEQVVCILEWDCFNRML